MKAKAPKGYWRVFPQEEGAFECLRHAVATATQIDPNDLPVSGTFLGDQLERFNTQLRAKHRLQLVEEPADWRPEDPREPWVACVKTRHEWQHAVVAVGNSLFFDPDEHFKALPLARIASALRIERLDLSELSFDEIADLALTLVVKPSIEGREVMARARMLMELDELSFQEALPLAYLDVDLPDVRQLLRKGSTPEQAVRILA